MMIKKYDIVRHILYANGSSTIGIVTEDKMCDKSPYVYILCNNFQIITCNKAVLVLISRYE